MCNSQNNCYICLTLKIYIMKYYNYIIEIDRTGYAPDCVKYSFFLDDGELYCGSGASLEDCKQQINNNLAYYKLMNNNCYSVFNFNDLELEKNCINKSEVYAFCRYSELKLIKR